MNDTITNAGSERHTPNAALQAQTTREADEFHLLDVAIALGEEKRTIFGTAFVVTLVGLLVSLLLTPTFTATTVLLPPQQQSSAESALAGLGALAGFAGGGLGLKTPDQMYVGLIESDTVADHLIERFQLKERYHAKLMQDARMALRHHVTITTDKLSGFITIRAIDKSAVFSAQLANAYVSELRLMLDHLAITRGQQQVVFFQHEIDQTKEKLGEAEIAFKNAQRASGIVSLDSQVLGSIRQSADLRAQIAAREIQLKSMLTYATMSNPDVKRVSAEIQAMQAQLATLESGNVSGATSDSKDPNDAAALANIRAFREVKYEEAQLDAFTKQLELAQLDVAREGPLVQQIDVAMPPEKKSAPKRALITITSAFAGLVLGVIIAFARRALRVDTETTQKLAQMRTAWALRRRVR